MAFRILPRPACARAFVLVVTGFVGLALLAFAVGLLLLRAAGVMPHHDSDAALIERFHGHREALERLRAEISAEPGMANVFRDGIYPENLFAPEHVAAYREQLRCVGLSEWFTIEEDGSIRFVKTSGGTIQHGSRKGYAYLATAPDSLCRDLDEASEAMRPFPYRGWSGYRPIEGNWYLWFYGH